MYLPRNLGEQRDKANGGRSDDPSPPHHSTTTMGGGGRGESEVNFMKWKSMEELKKEVQEARAKLPPPRKWVNTFEYTWKFCILEGETKAEQQKRIKEKWGKEAG